MYTTHKRKNLIVLVLIHCLLNDEVNWITISGSNDEVNWITISGSENVEEPVRMVATY